MGKHQRFGTELVKNEEYNFLYTTCTIKYVAINREIRIGATPIYLKTEACFLEVIVDE